MTEGNIKYIIGIGCLSHVLNYYLEELTLRGNTSYWIILLFSSLIGFFYMIRKFEILHDKNYRELMGLKLQSYKLLLIALTFVSSMIVFGGYLNNATLGINYLLRKGNLQVEQFKVLKIDKSKPGFKKRTKRRAPELVISNEQLIDKIELTTLEFDDLKEEIEYIEIEYKEGYLGWGIIEKVIIN